MQRYKVHFSLAAVIVLLCFLLLNITAKTNYNGHFKSVQQFSNSANSNGTPKVKI